MSYVYILQCSENKIYVGHTANAERRLKQHRDGKGSWYTKRFPPIRLLAIFSGDEQLEDFLAKVLRDSYGKDEVSGGVYIEWKRDSNAKRRARLASGQTVSAPPPLQLLRDRLNRLFI
jgi:hypothetical protein